MWAGHTSASFQLVVRFLALVFHHQTDVEDLAGSAMKYSQTYTCCFFVCLFVFFAFFSSFSPLVKHFLSFMTTLFVCFQVLWPSQLNAVMLSAVSLPNHTFTG